MTKRTVDQIIHLALMYGILDRKAYADACAPPPDYHGKEVCEAWERDMKTHYDEALSEIEDMQRYHKKRYGWKIPM